MKAIKNRWWLNSNSARVKIFLTGIHYSAYYLV